MISPSGCIEALWIGWGAVWLVAAPWTKRTVERQSFVSALGDRALVWAGVALMLVHGDVGWVLRSAVRPGSWPAWVGAALVAAGVGVAAWARFHLGRNWSPVVALKEGHALTPTPCRRRDGRKAVGQVIRRPAPGIAAPDAVAHPIRPFASEMADLRSAMVPQGQGRSAP
jgi:hypothetical protein